MIKGIIWASRVRWYGRQRMPSELSEEQRQRAALGCALITNPGVIFLGEPLIALDESLRLKIRVELKRLQGGLGITFMQVARTQPEVIDLADKMIVMDRVITEQGDHPRAVYDRPLGSCIARFMGRRSAITVTDSGLPNGHFTAKFESGDRFDFPDKGDVSVGDQMRRVKIRVLKKMQCRTRTHFVVKLLRWNTKVHSSKFG